MSMERRSAGWNAMPPAHQNRLSPERREVTTVMLDVLGLVPIDVFQRHVRPEVRIARRRVAHPPRKFRVTLPVYVTQQLVDTWSNRRSPRVPMQTLPANRSEVVDDMEGLAEAFERARERTADAVGQSAEDPYENQQQFRVVKLTIDQVTKEDVAA